MFIDSAKIYVRAGSGGRGCQSFCRGKYARRGIPDGGDGGRGADIIVRSDRNLLTLLDLKYRQHFYGQDGGNGSGKNKKGKDSTPVIVRVPVGTRVLEFGSDCLLRDLKSDGDEVRVARGGNGALGNRHRGQGGEGEPGEERQLLLDLKLIADVGIVGFPNAGKSTLISAISNAHPKIAAYPFTTKSPVLGAVRFKDKAFIVADIPGLIAGSSEGRGLGDKFLRHVERTKVLLHLVDASGSDGRCPYQDYKTINEELKNYSKALHSKLKIVAANKLDLKSAQINLSGLKKRIKKKIYPISALKNQGLKELIEAIGKRI